MTQKSPTPPLWVRFLTIAMGIVVLFWIPVEDTSAWVTTLIALAISALIALRVLIYRAPETPKGILFHGLIGALGGVAAMLVNLLLMAFKTGIHGHGASIPDFTAGQVMQVLQDTTLWVSGGGFIGLGSGTWRYAQRT